MGSRPWLLEVAWLNTIKSRRLPLTVPLDALLVDTGDFVPV